MTQQTSTDITLDALTQLELVRGVLARETSASCWLTRVEWGENTTMASPHDTLQLAWGDQPGAPQWSLVLKSGSARRVLCRGSVWNPGGAVSTRDLSLEDALDLSQAAEGLPAPATWLSVERYGIPADSTDEVRALILDKAGERRAIIGLEVAAETSNSGSNSHGKGIDTDRLLEDIRRGLADFHRIPVSLVQEDESFSTFGLDSINVIELAEDLSSVVGYTLTPDLFFRYGSCLELAKGLANEAPAAVTHKYGISDSPESAEITTRQRPAVLALPADRGLLIPARKSVVDDRRGIPADIIGLSGRFPGAADVDELWHQVVTGGTAIGPVPADRPGLPSGGGLVGGWIDGIDEFDARFFGVTPRDAEQMDPRQRLLLQEMWRGLEDAGVGKQELRNHRVGVFVGVEGGDYAHYLGDNDGLTGTNDAVLAARLAYFLDLHGPVMAINTACSSGLLALHEARLSIVNGECDMAIVAAANILSHAVTIETMRSAGMLSPTGVCHAFDRRADGMVTGEAVTVMVLQRSDLAREQRRRVYARLLASGVNHDGKTQGITAPNGTAQTELVREVLRSSGVDSRAVGLVVAHGTGTPLGDSVEVKALEAVFSNRRNDPVALISTKPNVGHSQAASGLVSATIAARALWSATVPPSRDFEQPSEYVDWAASALRVPTQSEPWPWNEQPRIASVSAFGVSGTNVHMMMMSCDQLRYDDTESSSHLFLLSGMTDAAVRRQAHNLAQALESQDYTLPSVARTLALGRQHLPHRAAVIGATGDDLIRALQSVADGTFPITTVPQHFQEKKVQARLLEDLVHSCRTYRGAELLETLEVLGDAYMQGYVPPLAGLWEELPPTASLPGYPFEREHYWVTSEVSAQAPVERGRLAGLNVSSLQQGLATQTTWDASNPLVADHLSHGVPILPAAGHLAVLCDAARILSCSDAHAQTLVLTDLEITQPFSVTAPTDAFVFADLRDDGAVVLDLVAGTDEAEKSAVTMILEESDRPRPVVNVSNMSGLRRSGAEIRAALEKEGLRYGEWYHTLDEVIVDGSMAIATARSSTTLWDDALIRPDVLDGIFQATIALGEEQMMPSRPFRMDRVTVFMPMPRNVVARITHLGRSSRVEKFDIEIFDTDGNVVLEVRGFSSVLSAASMHDNDATITAVLAPSWEPLEETRELSAARGRYVAASGVTVSGAGAMLHPLPALDDTAESFTLVAENLLRLAQDLMESKPATPRLLQVVVPLGLGAGLVGMVASIGQESRRIIPQLIEVGPQVTAHDLERLLATQAGIEQPETHLRVTDGDIARMQWKRLPEREREWKPGTYVVTGGLGGLGLLVTRDILSAPATQVVLTGRSIAGDRSNGVLADLDAGERVSYEQMDLLDEVDVRRVVAKQRDLVGVIHCAGTTRDGSLRTKTTDDLHAVLAPKVWGCVNLDEATKDLPLDVFVLFASTTGAVGNAGQTDYAAANGFMDAWAHKRAALVESGQRHGTTVSIDWSLWADGGMSMPAATLEKLGRETGFAAIPASSGIHALHTSLASKLPQTLCMSALPGRFEEAMVDLVGAPAPRATNQLAAMPIAHADSPASEQDPVQAVLTVVTHALHEHLKLSFEWLDPNASLDQLGLDSISSIDVIEDLESRLGSLPRTLFFEHETLISLAREIVSERPEAVADLLRLEVCDAPPALPDVNQARPAASAPRHSRRQRRVPNSVQRIASTPDHGPLDMAIVGIAGRYPGANNLTELWENLLHGRDTVGTLPDGRWSMGDVRWADAYDRLVPQDGGFLTDIDHFDPYFFNISPREAAEMDPQERLFLRCVYETIQDAGYTPGDLSASGAASTGVFVGLMTMEYQFFGVEAQQRGRSIAVAGNLAGVPNRVSYHLNLKGPSVATDTMCSSSLTVLDQACRAIQAGQCRQAIVGGVNLTLHPNKSLLLATNAFISPTGRCHAFGKDADGYVPSEGVGAILLKPLAAAVEARDHIYGVVKGSQLNHAGRTTGFTVPSAVAQAEVIRGAIEESGINPADVTYVEAHGTGTKLGDPIEVKGLLKGFGDGAACAVGSMKASIGHCEGAAGIAALTRVLLQMKHKTVVPSLHSSELNPLLELEGSRFYVPQHAAPWKRMSEHKPLVAGISAFGAGGSNAHVIVAEHVASRDHAVAFGPEVVVLSAKSEAALRQMAARLLTVLRRGDVAENDLDALAFTLQVGREAFAWRAAAVVADLEDVRSWLASVSDGQGISHVDLHRPATFVARGAEAPTKLRDAWLAGEFSTWNGIVSQGRRLSLPTYPFEEEPYWLDFGDPGVELRGTVSAMSQTRPVAMVSTAVSPESTPSMVSREAMVDRALNACHASIAEVLQIPVPRQDPDDSFQDLGFDSVTIVEFADSLCDELGCDVSPDSMFNHPTPRRLAIYLADECMTSPLEDQDVSEPDPYRENQIPGTGARPQPTRENSTAMDRDHVCVIGRAVRAAQNDDVEVLWSSILAAESQIVDLAGQRPGWDKTPRHVAALSDIERFDPVFFEISPREAVGMDPRARLLLQEMWHALEDASIGPDALRKSRVGVFVGVEDGDYQFIENEDRRVASNHTGALAARLSYLLDLHGPVVATNTACSSGLVALHQAAASLTAGECDLAIVGAVNVLAHPATYDAMVSAGMLSRTGVCSAFSANADGMVAGEAVAAVVLTRESWAVQTGRREYGVIVASGINYDGRTNGLTAPNGEAQRALESEVYASAAIGPDEIDLVITHGTGTTLGDPIEANALASAHTALGSGENSCALVSVKPVVGHSQAASGLVSLIVLMEAMRHETLPGNPACEPVNPHLRLQGSPVYLSSTSRPWVSPVNHPRCGAVSAFGISGTNAHVVVREPTHSHTSHPESHMNASLPLLVSAKTARALDERLLDLARLCASEQAPDLPALVRTAAEGRHHHEHRFAAVVSSVEEAAKAMRAAVVDVDGGPTRRVLTRDALRAEASSEMSRLAAGLNGPGAAASAESIAQRYLEGACPAPMPALGMTVSLPGYPFEREPFWPSRPQALHSPFQPMSQSTSQAGTVTSQAPVGVGWQPKMAGWSLADRVSDAVRREVAAVVRLEASAIDTTASLQAYGMDSMLQVELAGNLEENLGVPILPTDFYRATTIDALVTHILAHHAEEMQRLFQGPEDSAAPTAVALDSFQAVTVHAKSGLSVPERDTTRRDAVAVVGLAGRFPKARDVDALWELMTSGHSAIDTVPSERAEFHADTATRWMGTLEGVGEFDARFFDIAPREAFQMDPRQRLLMQEMWHAIEDAALTDEELHHERVGVYVGIEEGDYLGLLESASVTSNANSVLAARISYFLNLSGPCMAINTACSSGLAALHQARLGLETGDCDTAIVAAANIISDSKVYDAMADAGMLSSTGVCRAYDGEADGMVPGEAVAVIVLQRESKARGQGRRVRARLLSSAMNYDGRSQSITAPSGHAQEEVIRRALANADVTTDSIGLVIGHGTGTPLGDPIEVSALANAYADASQQSIALMSVKPTVGHAQATAGLINLIVAMAAMEHGSIPPSLSCGHPSDHVAWETTPFWLNRELTSWPQGAALRRSATSAFGFSGTNVHVILEQGDPKPTAAGTATPTLLVVSGSDEAALSRQLSVLANWLQDHRETPLQGIARTLAEGRQHLTHRAALVVADIDGAIDSLAAAAQGRQSSRVFLGTVARGTHSVASLSSFVAQQVGMIGQGNPEQVDDALRSVGELYCQGYDIPVGTFGDAPLLSLPGYCFEPKVYWRGPGVATSPEFQSVTQTEPQPQFQSAPTQTALSDPVDVIREVDSAGPVVETKVTLPDLAQDGATEVVSVTEPVTPAPLLPSDAVPAATVQQTHAADAPVVGAPAVQAADIVDRLVASLARELFVEPDEVELDRSFMEQGLDSIVGVEWMRAINTELGLKLSTTKLYEFPTMDTFAVMVAQEMSAASRHSDPEEQSVPDDLDLLLQQVYDGNVAPDEAAGLISNEEK